MSDLKKKFEVMDYLKRNKSKFHNLSARKVRDEVQTMFDVTYSEYLMRKMMIAADIRVNSNKPKKVSLTEMANAVNSIKIDPPSERGEFTMRTIKEIKDQLNHIENKVDFVCDFIQYAKTGEVPQ
tara:strand:+ start:546 stop:920 length:375 start_codon:yes stop_codon:yes gene_type:complete